MFNISKHMVLNPHYS